MSGKPGASGGAREGAGRPLNTYRGVSYTGETPTEKLWLWLAERCGPELANEAHLYFNEEKRAYEKRRQDALAEKRKEEQTITFPRRRASRKQKDG